MECLLCGKNYINLGVHLRHKHQEDPADYREQFGLMKTTPLVDKSLSDHLSRAAKRRLLDPDYLLEVTQRCKENSKNSIDRTPHSMSKAGKLKLAARNSSAHAARLSELAPTVKKILDEKKTLLDVRRDIGMGRPSILKIIAAGKASYSKEEALLVGTQRRVASRMKRS